MPFSAQTSYQFLSQAYKKKLPPSQFHLIEYAKNIIFHFKITPSHNCPAPISKRHETFRFRQLVEKVVQRVVLRDGRDWKVRLARAHLPHLLPLLLLLVVVLVGGKVKVLGLLEQVLEPVDDAANALLDRVLGQEVGNVEVLALLEAVEGAAEALVCLPARPLTLNISSVAVYVPQLAF